METTELTASPPTSRRRSSLTAFYFAAGDMVRLNGAPQRDVEHPPHPFMLEDIINDPRR